MEKLTSILKEQWGSHNTHCCEIHGCKYGNEDCPVVLGITQALYECEECNDTIIKELQFTESKLMECDYSEGFIRKFYIHNGKLEYTNLWNHNVILHGNYDFLVKTANKVNRKDVLRSLKWMFS